jgi:hypothetical protein
MTLDNINDNPYRSLTHHTKIRELDHQRIFKLSQPRMLPIIGKKSTKKRFIRMKVDKSLTLSSELPPNDAARLILYNTAKASKNSIFKFNRCVWSRHKKCSSFR